MDGPIIILAPVTLLGCMILELGGTIGGGW